jgi:hypothetical protein
MYTGNNPDLANLQAQITALVARVNTLDGQNLDDPAQGALSQLTKKYAGLKTDLRQAVTLLEGILNGYKKTVTDFGTKLNQHLGV